MTPLRICSLVFLATLIFITQGLFAQGLYYESVLKGGPFKEKGNVSKTYLMPKVMKHINSEDQDFLVLQLDKEKIISVDTKKKTYWEKTFVEIEESMKAASAEMDEQMSKMRAQMKDLPEGQRKMMEKMLGKQMGNEGGKVQMINTGETKKISGFSCTKFVAKEGEKELMTMWTTREVKGFEPLRKDYVALSKRLTSMNPWFMKGLVDAMFKIEGFPIQTDWGEMSTTVTKVEQRSVPESEFAVPAGYTKEEAPETGMHER